MTIATANSMMLPRSMNARNSLSMVRLLRGGRPHPRAAGDPLHGARPGDAQITQRSTRVMSA
jgi:hypothetical protein